MLFCFFFSLDEIHFSFPFSLLHYTFKQNISIIIVIVMDTLHNHFDFISADEYGIIEFIFYVSAILLLYYVFEGLCNNFLFEGRGWGPPNEANSLM